MKKVLIANRGEIAVRIIRACRDHGLASVAVYADDDFGAPYTLLADEAHALNGTAAAETYLDAPKLLAVAARSGADAVHPGYGFLAENAAFAEAVTAAGLTWIGPPPEAMRLLGDKLRARELAVRVDAPVVAGTTGAIIDASEVRSFVRRHGLPVAIKAAHGGGGRGLKVIRDETEIPELFASAVREAEAAFGRGECFVEQFLDRPRHVEVQVLADAHGNVRIIGTRDCSVQRRNQKLVEEAPATFLTPGQLELLHGAALRICREAGYAGAGTVEFLIGQDGTVSFLEVNTRLQVEHPVTEETTGIDLVREQFRIAAGESLTETHTPPAWGHALEFRINAEDPGRGFLPATGTITRFEPPGGPGIRVDSGVAAGSTVSGYFDSLLAKLIVWGPTRQVALQRAGRALDEFVVEGVPTVLPAARAVLKHPDFTAEAGFRVHTGWLEEKLAERLHAQAAGRPPAAAGLRRFHIEVDGRLAELGLPAALLRGLDAGGREEEADGSAPAAEDAVTAPAAGRLLSWSVADGATVRAGEAVAVLEAMKMEIHISAPRDGVVQLIAEPGSDQPAGAVLARIS